MKKKLTLGVFAAAALLTGLITVSTRTIASEREANQELNHTIQHREAQGWHLSSRNAGHIHQGESTTFNVHIEGGHPHLLTVVGCEDAYNLDLYLYDHHGDQVASDTLVHDWPAIVFTDEHGGDYKLTLKAPRVAHDGGHYGLALMARGH